MRFSNRLVVTSISLTVGLSVLLSLLPGITELAHADPGSAPEATVPQAAGFFRTSDGIYHTTQDCPQLYAGYTACGHS